MCSRCPRQDGELVLVYRGATGTPPYLVPAAHLGARGGFCYTGGGSGPKIARLSCLLAAYRQPTSIALSSRQSETQLICYTGLKMPCWFSPSILHFVRCSVQRSALCVALVRCSVLFHTRHRTVCYCHYIDLVGRLVCRTLFATYCLSAIWSLTVLL